MTGGGIDIEARVRTSAQTGVEMEALTAVAIAGLTVYDMVKAADKTMRLTDVRLMEKRGGQSGEYLAADAPTLAPAGAPARARTKNTRAKSTGPKR
jgi:cyclic pyranopterin phosphate synthase